MSGLADLRAGLDAAMETVRFQGGRMTTALTRSQRAALKWLHNRGGDGLFDRSHGNTVLAAGEISPVMRATWNALRDHGLLEQYGPKLRRVRLTDAGRVMAADLQCEESAQ